MGNTLIQAGFQNGLMKLINKIKIEEQNVVDSMRKMKIIDLKSDNIQKENYKARLIQPGEDILNVIPNCASILVYKAKANKLQKG